MTAIHDISDVTNGLAPPTVDALRESVRMIGDDIERRSEELGVSRRVPDDLYETIARSGLFRQLVPREMGGVGATPAEWFANGVELASRDASVGWVVTQGAAEFGWIANGGDPAWAAEVLADPLAASASTIAGHGTLTIDGDTGVLEGRWAFDTGCHGATWIGGQAAVLPVAIAATFIGKNSVEQIIDADFEHVYEISLEVVDRMGKVTKQDASNGVIKARINGARISLHLRKKADNTTEITISARKYLLPKLDIAGGVLYQILDKLE